MSKSAALGPLERKLLAAVSRELRRLRAVDLARLPNDRFAAADLRGAVNDARKGIVALDLDVLLGDVPAPSERRAAHRALARLETAGRIERLKFGPASGRATHIRLLAEVPEAVAGKRPATRTGSPKSGPARPRGKRA